MYTVHYLDLEYILVRLYELLSGIQINVSGIPHTLVVAGSDLTIVGWVVGILLFIAAIYLRIRIVQVEEAGFAHRAQVLEQQRAQETHRGINSRWDTIFTLAHSSQEGDWRRAILDADAMLSEVLDAHGYTGETIGYQLKQINPLQFATVDLAWEAHKMRNTIAHLGEGFPLTERDVDATIDLYRRVFEEFGAV